MLSYKFGRINRLCSFMLNGPRETSETPLSKLQCANIIVPNIRSLGSYIYIYVM